MEAWMQTLWEMECKAVWVMLAVLAARFVLKKLPRRYMYALWAVVGFRLACPFSFDSVFSLMPRTVVQLSSQSRPAAAPNLPAAGAPTAVPGGGAVPYTPAAPAEAAGLSLSQILGWVWLGGMLALLAYSLITLIRLARQTSLAWHWQDNVYVMRSIRSPFVYGLLRPRIYLPARLDDISVEMILAHERAHIRRGDHWAKIFAWLLVCVHWFNPLVWVCFLLFERDMEISCDERVVRDYPLEQRKLYSQVLLSLSAPRHLLSGCPLAFGENDVVGRVKSVLHYKKPAFWLALLAVAAVAALCLGLAGDPAGNTASGSAKKELVEVYEWRTQYVGSASSVGNIVSRLAWPREVTYDGFALHTDAAPYGVTVHLRRDFDSNHEPVFTRNAVAMFALIQNVDEIHLMIEDGSPEPVTYTYTRAMAEEVAGFQDLWGYAATFDDFVTLYESIVPILEKQNAPAATALPEDTQPADVPSALPEQTSIVMMLEGMEEIVPAMRHQGEGYTILIPAEGWNNTAPDQWNAANNDQVWFWVNRQAAGDGTEKNGYGLEKQGYTKADGGEVWGKLRSDGLAETVYLSVYPNGVWAFHAVHPETSEYYEGYGSRMAYIAQTLQVPQPSLHDQFNGDDDAAFAYMAGLDAAGLMGLVDRVDGAYATMLVDELLHRLYEDADSFLQTLSTQRANTAAFVVDLLAPQIPYHPEVRTILPELKDRARSGPYADWATLLLEQMPYDTQKTTTVGEIANHFARAYFSDSPDLLKTFLSEDFEGQAVVYTGGEVDVNYTDLMTQYTPLYPEGYHYVMYLPFLELEQARNAGIPEREIPVSRLVMELAPVGESYRIIWYELESEYTESETPSAAETLEDAVKRFGEAYFGDDMAALQACLAEDFTGKAELYPYDKVEVNYENMSMLDTPARMEDDHLVPHYVVSLPFIETDPELIKSQGQKITDNSYLISHTFLTMELKQVGDVYKVYWYGLEK